VARIVLISPYLKGGQNAAKLAQRTRYVATRPGVKLLADERSTLPATKKAARCGCTCEPVWKCIFCAAIVKETFAKVVALCAGLWYVLWLPKGGAAMYDYMKALQKRFDRQEHSELDTQIERAQEELRRDMDAAGRRKLLHLLDAQNALLAESTLMSFTAGFKLAAGIAGELGTPYSFDADEEQKAKEMITNG
jgi:hypothetical protein